MGYKLKIGPWVIFVVLVNSFFHCDCESSNVMKIFQGDSHLEQSRNLLKYNTDRAQKNNTDEDYIAYDLQIVVNAIRKLNDSQCGQDGILVMEGIARRERWAIKMFDASSKFPIGLLHGNLYQMGNFDECVSLKQPIISSKNEPIQGQYCLADVELSNKKYEGRTSFQSVKPKSRHIFNSTMFWSICVPSSCSVQEVELVIKEIFALATKQKTVTVRLTSDKCHVKRSHPLTSLEIIYGCVIGAFGAFIISATVYHYYALLPTKNSHNIEDNDSAAPKVSTLKEVISCFSLISTVGNIFKVNTSGPHLRCISGVKFLSMLFIIAGHTCLFLVGGPVKNSDFYQEQSESLMNAIFINSPLLVDSFLLLSGFLMCYLLLLELDKRRGRINVFVLYVARYVRLTPSYLVVIGFYCTFFYRINDGPLWNSRIKVEQERCQTSWWINLLYINNYVNTDNMCMFQAWYLAVDYHLFIISPIIIYPLWKWPKIGKIILGLCIFASVATQFIITFKDRLDPTLMIFAPEVYDISQNVYFKTAYVKTHMRAESYFLGVLFGYVLYKFQINGAKLPKLVLYLGWLLSSTCGIVSMYTIVVFYNPNHQYNTFEAAIYASLHRVAWSIFIGWIIVVCITKNASILDGFLSWKPFIPLSRLTYCAYLVNGFVEVYSFATIREPIYMSKHSIAAQVLSHIVLTLAYAFLLCIFFESPIHGLEKIILRKADAKNRKISVGENNVTMENDQPT